MPVRFGLARILFNGIIPVVFKSSNSVSPRLLCDIIHMSKDFCDFCKDSDVILLIPSGLVRTVFPLISIILVNWLCVI